jgi:CBS domain-containing protein
VGEQSNRPQQRPREGDFIVIREYFLPLPAVRLDANARLYRPAQDLPARVTLESPALDVMTDLRQLPAQTIEPELPIEEANAKMIRQGVRLLFVTDTQHRLLGLITASDILGQNLVQFMRTHGLSRHEVRVRDIMTPRERLEAIDMAEVRVAKVGHVISTLKEAGRQHAIVVEIEVYAPTLHERLTTQRQPGVMQTVSGLFSTTQIARQLGLQLQSAELATTFAEVEALLAH